MYWEFKYGCAWLRKSRGDREDKRERRGGMEKKGSSRFAWVWNKTEPECSWLWPQHSEKHLGGENFAPKCQTERQNKRECFKEVWKVWQSGWSGWKRKINVLVQLRFGKLLKEFAGTFWSKGHTLSIPLSNQDTYVDNYFVFFSSFFWNFQLSSQVFSC